MKTKIKPKRITDFKNDLIFKFMLSDLNDSRCYYLLKVIIEGITGIKCQELFVLNSEVNPEHLSDKDMVLDVRVKTDEGKLIDIEMAKMTGAVTPTPANSGSMRIRPQYSQGMIFLCILYRSSFIPLTTSWISPSTRT